MQVSEQATPTTETRLTVAQEKAMARLRGGHSPLYSGYDIYKGRSRVRTAPATLRALERMGLVVVTEYRDTETGAMRIYAQLPPEEITQ